MYRKFLFVPTHNFANLWNSLKFSLVNPSKKTGTFQKNEEIVGKEGILGRGAGEEISCRFGKQRCVLQLQIPSPSSIVWNDKSSSSLFLPLVTPEKFSQKTVLFMARGCRFLENKRSVFAKTSSRKTKAKKSIISSSWNLIKSSCGGDRHTSSLPPPPQSPHFSILFPSCHFPSKIESIWHLREVFLGKTQWGKRKECLSLSRSCWEGFLLLHK